MALIFYLCYSVRRIIKWDSVWAEVLSAHHSHGPRHSAAPPKQDLLRAGWGPRFGDASSTPTSSLSMRLLRLKGDLEIGDDAASVPSTPPSCWEGGKESLVGVPWNLGSKWTVSQSCQRNRKGRSWLIQPVTEERMWTGRDCFPLREVFCDIVSDRPKKVHSCLSRMSSQLWSSAQQTHQIFSGRLWLSLPL